MTTTRPWHSPAALAAVMGPLAVGTALIGAASLVEPQQPTSRPVADVQPVRRVACGFAGESGTLVASSAQVQVAAESGPLRDPLRPGAVTSPVTVSQTGGDPLSAGVISNAPAAAWAECSVPSTRGSVVVTRPESVDLLVANPDRAEALVTVTLSGPTGPIQTTGLGGIRVPGGRVVRLPMSVHAPAGTPVTASYVAARGRVQVSSVLTMGGQEQVLATTPAPVLTFVGLPTGSAQVRLVLHNPGESRVDATLEILGVRGRFSPDNPTVSLEPGVTVALDLAQPLNGQAAGVLVRASGDVAGLLEARTTRDVAWVASSAQTTRRVGVVAAGSLQVVNPGMEQVEVTITSAGYAVRRVSIPAGAMRDFPVNQGRVEVTGTHPLSAGVALSGRDGMTSMRLRPVQSTTRPSPGLLDPALGQR